MFRRSKWIVQTVNSVPCLLGARKDGVPYLAAGPIDFGVLRGLVENPDRLFDPPPLSEAEYVSLGADARAANSADDGKNARFRLALPAIDVTPARTLRVLLMLGVVDSQKLPNGLIDYLDGVESGNPPKDKPSSKLVETWETYFVPWKGKNGPEAWVAGLEIWSSLLPDFPQDLHPTGHGFSVMEVSSCEHTVVFAVDRIRPEMVTSTLETTDKAILAFVGANGELVVAIHEVNAAIAYPRSGELASIRVAILEAGFESRNGQYARTKPLTTGAELLVFLDSFERLVHPGAERGIRAGLRRTSARLAETGVPA